MNCQRVRDEKITGKDCLLSQAAQAVLDLFA